MLGFIVLLSIGLLLTIFCAGRSSASPAPKPINYDFSTLNDTVIKVYTYCDFRVIEPRTTAPFDILVMDRRNIPIEGADLQIVVYGKGIVDVLTGTTDADGKASFSFTSADATKETETWVVVYASKPGYYKGYSNVAFTTIPERSVLPHGDYWLATAGFLGTAAVFSTELGRYGLARLLFPLYTRLKKDEVLEHFVRGQIYGYIVSNPGDHYSLIKEALKVNNGTLSHHLRTLEVQGFVKSRRDGALRRFYPIKMNIPQGEGQQLSDLQLGILDIIRQTGTEGATQRFIADMIDASQQTVSYNLRALSRHGVVRIEQDGRRARYYIMNT
jgi:predicted transcriptional regulator